MIGQQVVCADTQSEGESTNLQLFPGGGGRLEITQRPCGYPAWPLRDEQLRPLCRRNGYVCLPGTPPVAPPSDRNPGGRWPEQPNDRVEVRTVDPVSRLG